MNRFVVLLTAFLFLSCAQKRESLPFLGNAVQESDASGAVVSNYFQVPDFRFLNQDSLAVTNDSFKNQIYVADFIFLKCPTICPVMNMELKRVYDTYIKSEEVVFLSHTIDPESDSIPALKAYANQLGVDSKKWHFLHGEQQQMYRMAEKGYFAQAYQDAQAPGGYAHSAGFVLVDKNRHLRGVYDGTNAADVDRLIRDIEVLLGEHLDRKNLN